MAGRRHIFLHKLDFLISVILLLRTFAEGITQHVLHIPIGGEILRSVLKYPGSKGKIVKWLCSLIPEHDVYLEPFFGSGTVFFNKQKARIETINDLDGNVVNYFKVIRDHPQELMDALSLTPFARDEYEAAYLLNNLDDDVEKARKFAVKCWMGFGCGNLYKNGFRSTQQGNGPRTTHVWSLLPDIIRMSADRLLDAQIENLPAVELIKRYDTPDVFIYADPPYLGTLRKPYLYPHDMRTEEEHIELLTALKAHPGKVLLSGFDNGLYDSYLEGWHKETRASQAEKGVRRIECVWMNYELPETGQLSFNDI